MFVHEGVCVMNYRNKSVNIVCVYVRVYVCVCVYVCMCICVCMNVCVINYLNK